MLYVPQTDGQMWGADLPGSPVLLSPQFGGVPEPLTVLMIPLAQMVRWDGCTHGSVLTSEWK